VEIGLRTDGDYSMAELEWRTEKIQHGVITEIRQDESVLN
jgi:hypothetical protein